MNMLQRFIVVLAMSFVLVACSGGSQADGEGSGAAQDGFPKMGLAELDAYLAANKGKPTALMFWTTWCPSCKQAIPEMEKLAKSHGDSVNVITVSLDENVSALESYYANKEKVLPVYHGNEAIAQRFGVQAIPTLVLFDTEGNSVFAKPGVYPHEMLTKMAEKMMAGQK
ncbi:Alkyl hydroperoxide reductase/ Thiol specific antioxidant/ Mal allergen [Pseudodesulfovibrio profundus]|uniref:Alkyl hydroperoxide reductase/ Thiol specific antioxidant/ Mal allergen n=1 Tax=Pseudodesulfovibrio profundus TaxID=57320 RepID=A0A2C8F727_9BACT|nr:TlpA disulfide reductase family protein [Pseudodesulfovibrio profundus]MBC17863.1 alkyl hydroperoxide reductase [Desulfovibrio sp.]SOB58431.1 Alkyl hydroperoxide reductase/ Thiol specific antioxidant/ Mal allergen [Pseudodesulfovibrio profundus]|tara:strand:- start:1536 stop:2042 length:507 start_codon:yes stop_codon:yes gene_type:complete